MKAHTRSRFSFNNLQRVTFGAVVVTAIFATLLFSACGETDPDQEAVSTSTPSDDSEAVTQLPTTPAPAGTRVSTTSQEKLFLSADQFDEVEVDLTAGDLLRVVYTSEVTISPGLGGTGHQERGVLMVILDPNEEQHITAEESSDNSIDVTASLTGTHKIVFINPNQLEGLNVNLEYFINP